MNKTISLEDAKDVIDKFSTEDYFIAANIEFFLDRVGDPTDNSIELSDYYRECKSIVKEQLFQKHG